MQTEQLTQGLSIAAKIDPQTINNSSVNSGTGVDAALFKRLLFIINIGANAGSVVGKLQGATTSAGSFSDIAGSTLTAITAASKVATIEVRSDEVGDAQRWVKLVLTEGATQNAVVAATVLGGEAPHKPASNQDITAATQRLVV